MTKARSITIVGGAYTMAAIAIVVLGALVTPLLFSRGDRESLLIGLSFGQIGAVALWASSASVLTWRRVAICYLVAVVTALYFVIYEGRGIELDAVAMIVTIWAAHLTIVLAVHFALRWFRQRRRHYTEQGEQPPRFGMRHLLIASTVIAVGSLIVRFAVPELANSNVDTIVIWVLQSSAMVLVAIEAHRLGIAMVSQLGLLAIASLVGSYWLSTAIHWDDAVYANAVQAAVLAVALVVPRLEDYTLRITLETTEKEPAKDPEAQAELTE